jgi:hypothetical protein
LGLEDECIPASVAGRAGHSENPKDIQNIPNIPANIPERLSAAKVFPMATLVTTFTVLSVRNAVTGAPTAHSPNMTANVPAESATPRRINCARSSSRARARRLVREFFGHPNSLAA